MELWEVFQNLFKAVPMMVRGSVFNINFAGESEGDISITAKV
jgi:hypothetical protein